MFQYRFSRQPLARELADELLGKKEKIVPGDRRLSVNPSSGTFLNAPRRTGKTTFLRQDLLPVLDALGIPAIYVDLWEDKTRNPAELIADAVRSKLRDFDGWIKKFAKGAALQKIGVGTFSFDVEKALSAEGVTLSKVLQELAEKSPHKKIAVIVDEAQHALTTTEGESAMFALKAARDALNTDPANPRLVLLCTGSSRSRLGYLLQSKEHPFFGSKLRAFPTLGQDFIDGLTSHINSRIEGMKKVDSKGLEKAFGQLWTRPELLLSVIGEAFIDTKQGGDPNIVIAEKADGERNGLLGNLSKQFHSLSPIQQAVLRRLLDDEERFEPYSSTSMDEYRKRVPGDLGASAVQNALDELVKREIVWQSRRGGYHIDDPMWLDWYEFDTQAGSA